MSPKRPTGAERIANGVRTQVLRAEEVRRASLAKHRQLPVQAAHAGNDSLPPLNDGERISSPQPNNSMQRTALRAAADAER
jgi:hypothetical protein